MYTDSSALVKLFVPEEGSNIVKKISLTSQLVTSLITFSEVFSAITRATRDSRLPGDSFRAVESQVRIYWERIANVNVTEAIVENTAGIIKKHNLAGMDAIHLSTAKTVRDSSGEEFSFITWDRELWRAAKSEGFYVLPETMEVQ